MFFNIHTNRNSKICKIKFFFECLKKLNILKTYYEMTYNNKRNDFRNKNAQLKLQPNYYG